ncbi:MAG: carbohydrate binding domain-containing protein, partial [Phycisphaerae bacterium]|nr:carbohydrate binding domain-containing protein [Phycisphaerae bacterium]
RTYARELLTHVNKYRRARYADDPAVAFVEITNEDSLFMWGAERKLRSLDDYYAKILRWQYNEWLSKRYGTTAKLQAAWGKGAIPLGENMLEPVIRQREGNRRGWVLGQHGECEAGVWDWPLAAPKDANANGIRICIKKHDKTDWHIQFGHPGLRLKKGAHYTLTFEAHANVKDRRPLTVYAGQAHKPWRSLGLRRKVVLGPNVAMVRMCFQASANEENARVVFAVGGSGASVMLRNVKLMPGGREGLGKEEDLKARNVGLFAESETDARAMDRMRFLAETEKTYFDDMYAFIKKALGCKALVTGTIAFGPLGLWGQQDMDYIDNHAYWQHPRFPGRPWD